jgi:hypothetical protein
MISLVVKLMQSWDASKFLEGILHSGCIDDVGLEKSTLAAKVWVFVLWTKAFFVQLEWVYVTVGLSGY